MSEAGPQVTLTFDNGPEPDRGKAGRPRALYGGPARACRRPLMQPHLHPRAPAAERAEAGRGLSAPGAVERTCRGLARGLPCHSSFAPAAAGHPTGRTRTGAADRACHADVGAVAAAIGTTDGGTWRAGQDGGSRRSGASGAEADCTEDDRAAFRGSLLPRRRRRELHALRLPRRARAREARPDDVLGVWLTHLPRDLGAPGNGPNASATTSRVDWPAGRAPLRARMAPRIG
jgi:hypothetical protein